jgi:hypothetical protein
VLQGRSGAPSQSIRILNLDMILLGVLDGIAGQTPPPFPIVASVVFLLGFAVMVAQAFLYATAPYPLSNKNSPCGSGCLSASPSMR